MGLETLEAFKARVNKGEGDHRGKSRIRKEIHGELVHKIAIGMPLADGTSVTLGRQDISYRCRAAR